MKGKEWDCRGQWFRQRAVWSQRIRPLIDSISGILHRNAVLILTLLTLTSFYRGFDVPFVYAKTHWFLTYDFGFIKRGLVGTLVKPFLLGKTPSQIEHIVYTLSLMSVLLSYWAFLQFGKKLLRAAPPGQEGPIVLMLSSFFSSALLVFLAHCSGLFDQFAAAALIGAVVLASRKQDVLAGMLAGVAVAVHEIFLLYGLPSLAFFLVARHESSQGTASISRFEFPFSLVKVLVPSVLLAAAIVFTHQHVPDETIVGLDRQTAGYRVFSPKAVTFGTFHLSNSFSANYKAQREGSFVRRLKDRTINRVAFPVTVLLMFGTMLILRQRRWYFSMAILPFAVAAPLLLHLVAWDTARFTIATILPAFVCSGAVLLLNNRQRIDPWSAALFSCLALAVIISNYYFNVPLMNQQIDGQGLFELKSPAVIP